MKQLFPVEQCWWPDIIQRWKKRQTCLCYFSQLVLIFRPRARKTMCEECFTHCIISTRALNTSAISINNAFFILFADFSLFYWSFTLFCRDFFWLMVTHLSVGDKSWSQRKSIPTSWTLCKESYNLNISDYHGNT